MGIKINFETKKVSIDELDPGETFLDCNNEVYIKVWDNYGWLRDTSGSISEKSVEIALRFRDGVLASFDEDAMVSPCEVEATVVGVIES